MEYLFDIAVFYSPRLALPALLAECFTQTLPHDVVSTRLKQYVELLQDSILVPSGSPTKACNVIDREFPTEMVIGWQRRNQTNGIKVGFEIGIRGEVTKHFIAGRHVFGQMRKTPQEELSEG